MLPRVFLVSAALMMAGCWQRTGSPSLELSGRDAIDRLPVEVASLVPDEAILCLEDSREEGRYKLWILRQPGGTWLRFEGKNYRKLEHHTMPASALEGILGSRLPSLNRGSPTSPRCRFTHWRLADGAEIQVREMLFDQGWFASIERVAM